MNIVFLSGPHAVGKTFLVDKIIKNNPHYSKFDSGPVMRWFHQKYGNDLSIGEWVDKLESKYGDKITCFMLAKKLKEQLNESNTDNCIVIGFRQLIGIKYMVDILKPEAYSLCYLDASNELLYQNYNRRLANSTNARKDVPMTYKDFCMYLQKEQESGLSEIKNYCKTNNQGNYIFKPDNESNLCNIIIEKGFFENDERTK